MDISKIENHLKASKNNFISVEYKGRRLSKGTRSNKFLFDIDDVLKVEPTVKEFLATLPAKGFYNGTQLIIRRKNGSSQKEIGAITLNFKDGSPPAEQEQKTMENATTSKHNESPAQPSMGMPTNTTGPAQIGLGYAQVPQHSLIDLMVKEGRYHDLADKCKRAEEEATKAKNEVESLKLKNQSLELQVQTSERLHELDKKQAEIDQKPWHESPAIKEGIAALGAVLPQLLSKGQATPALAAPQTNSAIKKEFLEGIVSDQITDAHVTILKNVMIGMIQVQGFTDEIQTLLIKAQITNG